MQSLGGHGSPSADFLGPLTHALLQPLHLDSTFAPFPPIFS